MEKDESFSLQYLRDDSVVEAFAACCRSIGHHGNLSDTADFFLDVLRQRDTKCSESVYVLTRVMKGILLALLKFCTKAK